MSSITGGLFQPAIYINRTLGTGRTLLLLGTIPLITITTLAYGATQASAFADKDLISFALLASLVMLYLGAGFYFHLQQRLQALSQHSANISQGDFQHIAPTLQHDTLGQVENDIARLAKAFERLITRINQSALETHSASRSESEVAQRNADSATQQASAVAEVASATKQMAASVAQVTEQVNEIKDISERTEHQASEGEQVVSNAVDSIRNISAAVQQTIAKVDSLGQRSGQIGEIINVIEEVASQTNLLALNAAIEAARAGEHGRGFAVVSEEVRELAIRTHDATQKVSEMINGIQTEIEGTIQGIAGIDTQVSSSLELSDSVTEKLEIIKDGASKTAESLQLAASAITQQSQVCEVIRSNLDGINDMTLAASRDAEETKDTALYLETLSQRVLAILPDNNAHSGKRQSCP